jgi:hypothetical protein
LFFAFDLEVLTVFPETGVSIGPLVNPVLVIIQSLDSAASFSSHVAFLFSCRRETDLCYIAFINNENIKDMLNCDAYK